MLKNLARLEHIVDGKSFHLYCDQDSPISSVKDALVKFMAYISQIEEQVKAKQDAEKAAEQPVEDKVEELPKVEVE